MTTMILCFIAIAVCICAIAILCKMYYNLNKKYEDALDRLEEPQNDYDPDMNALTIKYMQRRIWQGNRANKMLFEILMDLIGEEDEGEAICRLIELRYKTMHMNTSNSDYVRKAYSMVNVKKDRSLNTIMCWLCSILDVREGKNHLSVLGRKDYNDSRNYVVSLQKQLISIKREIEEEQKRDEEVYEEEYYEEDEYNEVYDVDETSEHPSTIDGFKDKLWLKAS